MANPKVSYLQKVQVINEFRRMGDVTNAARRTGFSTSYVSEVFSGLYRNEDIVNAGFKVANARRSARARARA